MEVKFRGKRVDGKGWCYGNLRMIAGSAYIENCHDSAISVFKDSVGMWTGLKDKNKVEVYEGDILKFKDHEGVKMEGEKRLEHWPNLGVVFWDSGYFGNPNATVNCTELGGNNQPDWWMASSYEVIGNTTDNPELLK